jgi:LDH2 family malate/lactate/ureidoglycolate dehydrogenase
MLSIAFDPEAFAGAEAFAADVGRLIDWAKGSPPISRGGKVRLPGDLEDEVRAERLSAGIPVDDATWKAIAKTAALLAVAIPTG